MPNSLLMNNTMLRTIHASQSPHAVDRIDVESADLSMQGERDGGWQDEYDQIVMQTNQR